MTTELRIRVAHSRAIAREADGRGAFKETLSGAPAHPQELAVLREILHQNGRAKAVAKRALDLTCAATLLVLLSPGLLLIALILTFHLRGAPLFLHKRVGRGGALFKCLKIRTMRVPKPGEEALPHPSFKEGADTRTTTLTRLLRKTSLDELPQLLNVLRGEMSMVGPRPIVLDELRLHFGPLAPVLLMAKPGMTGLWTVNGRSHVDYPERTFMELKYATTASLWLDMRILMKTVFAVVSRNGAL